MRKPTNFSQYDPATQALALVPDWRKGLRKRWPRIWLGLALALYAIVLGVVWETDASGPEHWWLSTLNVYLPQAAWLLPGVILLILCAWLARAWIPFPVLLLLWVAGPLMGFCWHSQPARPLAPATHLRVMTYNVEGRVNSLGVQEEIKSAKPDLVFIQEAGPDPPTFLDTHPGWHSYGPQGGCLIFSRLPLSQTEAFTLSHSEPWHQYIRCQMTLGDKTVTIYDLHLDTPRWGFEAVKTHQSGAIGTLQQDTAVRLFQVSRIAEEMRREKGPLLVAGDFNAPMPSLVCKTLTQDHLQDVFSAVGKGYGYSYGQRLLGGKSYIRIDHVLTSPEWQPTACWTGGATASDHRPVIADIWLK